MSPSPRSRSLACIRAPASATLESITDSDDSVLSNVGASDVVGPSPPFDLEKTFPAILAPLALLRKIPESEDIGALRALTPIFSRCLDEILHSMVHFPENVPTTQKYHLALSALRFSQEMFISYIGHIDDCLSSPRDAIQVAMQFLDMIMSSLKGFLGAAAYEAAQLKPLPEPPAEDNPAQASDDSEVSSPHTPSSEDHHHASSIEDTLASSSTDTHTSTPRSKVPALLKSFRSWRNERPSGRLGPASVGSAASSTLLDSDSESLSHSYVLINICDSLAQFPVSLDPTVAHISHPEDATELWKDRSGLAQLASLKALVRYMTSPDVDGDVEIIDVFFLCFRFFSTPQETFNTLVARYDENFDSRSSSMARPHSTQVKTRIARLLYLWVELHWRVDDMQVLSPLTQFAFGRLAQDIPQEAALKLVSSLLERARAGEKSKGLRREKTIARAQAKFPQDVLTSTWEPREKKSMIKGDFSRVKLVHFHSSGGHSTIALQLTLLLWEKYSAFEPEDAVRHLMTRNGDDNPPTSKIARKVANFMAYERAVHRFVMNSIGTAESVQMRTELTEFFLEVASKCHELRNYSASCLIALACDRPAVLPFVTKLKLNPAHEQMKTTLMDFYTRENQHMAGYKKALQSGSSPALPGMMLFIREVARGCGSGPHDAHPDIPGSRLINLKRYRPITWAVRAMEKCHVPFKIQRVDYICNWLEHALSDYLIGTENEWEDRIRDNCRKL